MGRRGGKDEVYHVEPLLAGTRMVLSRFQRCVGEVGASRSRRLSRLGFEED